MHELKSINQIFQAACRCSNVHYSISRLTLNRFCREHGFKSKSDLETVMNVSFHSYYIGRHKHYIVRFVNENAGNREFG